MLNKDLRQLKNLFEGLSSLIGKLRDLGRDSEINPPQSVPAAAIGESRPLCLSQATKTRFRRLHDLLHLLVLNRIEEHLEEINTLSSSVLLLAPIVPFPYHVVAHISCCLLPSSRLTTRTLCSISTSLLFKRAKTRRG
jgi:hypothetical protein